MAGMMLLAASAITAAAQGVQPPSLRCLEVMPNGDVQLTWVVPPDPGDDFGYYEVFHATDAAGPFTPVAQVNNDAQTTHVHPGAGADAAAQYYYMTTVSNGTPPESSAPSDTLRTIFMQVSQSVPLGSSVLDWNLIHDPPLPTTEPDIYVYTEYPAGTWNLSDGLANTATHWQHVVDICADSLNFYIEIPDASGCSSISNRTGAMFQDITPPTTPTIIAVSVDTATNQAVIEWEASPEADTDGYIIVWAGMGGNTILDTIYGQNNTSYTWPLSNAGAGPESYTVAAIDTCWRGNPPSPNTSSASMVHTTVHASTRYDRCAATIDLQFTDYQGWPVVGYEVYGTVWPSGTMELLATLPPDQLSHTVQGVLPERAYCFVVRAVGEGPTDFSLSNKTCRTTSYPPVPQWNYIRTATVVAPGRIAVVDSLDATGYTGRIVLERSYSGLPWMAIASMDAVDQPVATFIDNDVYTNERSYAYRVQVEDSCGVNVATSNRGATILLSADAAVDGTNELRWGGYVQWAGEVQHYQVFRSIADGPFQPVGTTTDWNYLDNVIHLDHTPGKFCYYVQAVETANPAGINATSTSNIACAVQKEEVWIPNAFIAGGVNNTFKPVLAYIDVDRYELIIYNRWGQQIWATTDREKAWDGRVNGSMVPQGIYAYYCTFRNGAGKTVEKRGLLTFLHAQ